MNRFKLLFFTAVLGALIFNHVKTESMADAGKKVTVTEDRVRMRSKPSLDGKIIDTLYRLQEFDDSIPVGKPQRIGSHNERWHEVTIKNVRRENPCTEEIIKGYVYGAFLDTPKSAEEKFKTFMLSNIPLEQKLMYRSFYNSRMLPDGKSVRIINACDVYEATESCVTSYFNWKKSNDSLSFALFYEYKRKDDGASEYIEDEKWTAACTVTGIKKTGDTYSLLVREDNPRCRAQLSGTSHKIGHITSTPCY